MIRTNLNTYSSLNIKFINKVILEKRLEMFQIIRKEININKIKSILDVGTTKEDDNLS